MISLLAHAVCGHYQTYGAFSIRYGYGKSNITELPTIKLGTPSLVLKGHCIEFGVV